MIRTCKQCGNNFVLTQTEIDFYNSKDLNLPKRCKACREQNKGNGLHNPKTTHMQYNNNPNSGSYTRYRYTGLQQLLDDSPIKAIMGGVVVILLVIIAFSLGAILSGNKYNTESSHTDIQLEPAKPFTVDSEEPTETVVSNNETEAVSDTEKPVRKYWFKNQKKLLEHYEKHGKEMGFQSAEEYEQAASDVINNPEAIHKPEKEDGDEVYYIESTNEFVVVTQTGWIRTYFKPDRGKAYYDKQ